MRTTRSQATTRKIAAAAATALLAITLPTIPMDGHALHFDHSPHGHSETRIEQAAHHDRERH